MFSIIVPVYNVEIYLPACIESVINQTYKKWELILVDDGSKDKSLEICRKYEDRDKRIRVVLGEHGGVSKARNRGLNDACGKYIVFLDSDDWIENNFLEEAVHLMEDEQLDILMTGWKRSSNDNINVIEKMESYKSDSIPENIFVELIKCNYISSVWGNVYKKELIDDLKFDTKLDFGEDLKFVFSALHKEGKKIKALPIAYYNYRDRSGSLTDSVDFQKLNGVYKIYEFLFDEINKRSILANTYQRYIGKRLESDLYWLYQVIKNDINKTEKEKDALVFELAKTNGLKWKIGGGISSRLIELFLFKIFIFYYDIKKFMNRIVNGIKRRIR